MLSEQDFAAWAKRVNLSDDARSTIAQVRKRIQSENSAVQRISNRFFMAALWRRGKTTPG